MIEAAGGKTPFYTWMTASEIINEIKSINKKGKYKASQEKYWQSTRVPLKSQTLVPIFQHVPCQLYESFRGINEHGLSSCANPVWTMCDSVWFCGVFLV